MLLTHLHGVHGVHGVYTCVHTGKNGHCTYIHMFPVNTRDTCMHALLLHAHRSPYNIVYMNIQCTCIYFQNVYRH